MHRACYTKRLVCISIPFRRTNDPLRIACNLRALRAATAARRYYLADSHTLTTLARSAVKMLRGVQRQARSRMHSERRRARSYRRPTMTVLKMNLVLFSHDCARPSGERDPHAAGEERRTERGLEPFLSGRSQICMRGK